MLLFAGIGQQMIGETTDKFILSDVTNEKRNVFCLNWEGSIPMEMGKFGYSKVGDLYLSIAGKC